MILPSVSKVGLSMVCRSLADSPKAPLTQDTWPLGVMPIIVVKVCVFLYVEISTLWALQKL